MVQIEVTTRWCGVDDNDECQLFSITPWMSLQRVLDTWCAKNGELTPDVVRFSYDGDVTPASLGFGGGTTMHVEAEVNETVFEKADKFLDCFRFCQGHTFRCLGLSISACHPIPPILSSFVAWRVKAFSRNADKDRERGELARSSWERRD